MTRGNMELSSFEGSVLNAILDASPESTFLMDPDGVVLFSNRVAAARLGVKVEELVGRCIYDLLPDGLVEQRRKRVQWVLENRRPLSFSDERFGRILAHFIHPVIDNRGRISMLAIFGQDISEYRRNEENLKRKTELLAAVGQTLSLFISGRDPKEIYSQLLHLLIVNTDSEYGFLDEVRVDEDGRPYKVNLAMSDISWDDESRILYQQLIDRGLAFHNLDNLAGAPVQRGEVIIANDAPGHACFRGLPPGHPPLRRYLGIPLFYGGQLLGVVAVANRESEYDAALVEEMDPLIQACALLIHSERLLLAQRQDQEALRRSEEKYRSIVETTNEGVWAMDEGYRTTFVNRCLLEMLGYSQEEMLGQRVDRFMFAEDRDSHEAQMASRKLGKEGTYERRFRRRDGSELWTIVSAKAVMDDAGRFQGSFAMLTDISERKKMEEALRESRRLLNEVEQITRIGGWEWDVDTERLHWTRETFRIHGLSEEDFPQPSKELIEKSIACYDAASRPLIERAFRECVALGKEYVLECPFTAQDGNKIWIQTMGRPVWQDGRVCAVRGNIIDITERRKAELGREAAFAELRSERDMMQRYLDIAGTLIVVLNREGQISMINRYGLNLLGYAEEDLLGRNWFETILPQPEGMNTVLPMFRAIMNGGDLSMDSFENEVLTSAGERRLIAWNNSFLRDEKGQLTGALSSGMDITEMRKMVRRQQRLQKADSLRRMAGAVAHHFNNLLHMVMGNIEMATLDGADATVSRQALDEAMHAARRAAELSGTMLTYLGQSYSEHQLVDIGELCRQTSEDFRGEIPKTIHLTSFFPNRSVPFSCDSFQIRHLLEILLRNSVEAIGEQPGSIELALDVLPRAQLPPGDRFPGDWRPFAGQYLRLQVSDSGCGISAADIEQLFDPFFTSKHTGRGLGLPVALGIAISHEGAIMVESETGRGTVFALLLPLSDKEGMHA